MTLPTDPTVPKSEKPSPSSVARLLRAWEEFRRGELSENGASWLLAAPVLEIRRPMRRWGRSLGLEPGVASAPRPDFLHLMTTGERSHGEFLRALSGKQRTNLANYLKQRGTLSATTRKSLAPVRWHLEAPGANATLPPLLLWFELNEGFLVQTFLVRLDSPNCLADRTGWDAHGWRAPGLDLAPEAAAFADRHLIALAMRHHIDFLQRPGDDAAGRWQRVLALAEPSLHPVGHWLAAMRDAAGAVTWQQLAARRPFALGRDDGANEARLRKWATGQAWLPQPRAEEMLAPLCETEQDDMRWRLRDARRLDLVLEFVSSAHRGVESPGRARVQPVLAARLQAIGQCAAEICDELAPLFDQVRDDAKRTAAP